MSYERCERCKNFCWDGDCKCVRFRVGVPWKGSVSEPRVVWARSAEAAAEKFAERYDSNDGDYPILKAGSGEVWVLDEDDVQTKWDIEAEHVPMYHAYEKRASPAGKNSDA